MTRPPTLMAGRSPLRTSAYACAAEMSRISDTSVREETAGHVVSVPSTGWVLRRVVHRALRSTGEMRSGQPQSVPMTDLPTTTASRLRPPSWRDSRLIIGVLLVLLSTVLGSVVVARADDRVPVYAAKGEVAPGQQARAADVVRVDVLLGDGAIGLPARRRPLPDDTWALAPAPRRTHPPGRRRQVGCRDGANKSRSSSTTSASALTAGSVVDVYVNRPKEGTTIGLPRC